jgi:hypothetical protein
MRVAHIDGVPIPTDWPPVRPNSKVRTTAAVEVARLLISPARTTVPRLPTGFSTQKNLAIHQNPSSTQHPDDAQVPRCKSLIAANGQAKKICADFGVTLEKTPSFMTTKPCDAEMGPLAEFGVVMKKKQKTKKLPDAIEAARALVKFTAKSLTTKAPIVFDRCDKDPADNLSPAKRRGRARTQPPTELRDEMPEHSDEAYFEAQSQLRQPSEQNGGPGSNGTVPASDYHRGGPRLSADEIEKIIDLYTNEYGAILRLDDAAEVTKLSKQTLRRKVCEGKFTSSVFRGTPLRFITRRLIEEVLG